MGIHFVAVHTSWYRLGLEGLDLIWDRSPVTGSSLNNLPQVWKGLPSWTPHLFPQLQVSRAPSILTSPITACLFCVQISPHAQPHTLTVCLTLRPECFTSAINTACPKANSASSEPSTLLPCPVGGGTLRPGD